MQTITKTYQVYSFKELSEEAQEKAINAAGMINITDDWWYNYMYEDAKEVGLTITGFDLDRNRHADGYFETSAHEVAENIIANHGPTCETYKTAKAFLKTAGTQCKCSDDCHTQECEEQRTEEDDNFLSDILEDYSVLLQEQYDYLQQKEAIIDTIEANEYTFFEDGTLANL